MPPHELTRLDVGLQAELAKQTPGDLAALVKEESQRQGEVPPSDQRIDALCAVVAGYLRTGPPLLLAADEARELAIGAFVMALPSWSQTDSSDYPLVAALLDDVFHQRELPTPPMATIELLHRLTIGLMRSKALPQTHAAQLAMADWIASLYLAGSAAW